MLYAALIWTEAPAEDEAELAEYGELAAAAADAGVHQGGRALHAADLATTIRFRDDDVLLTDGPFVDSKEQIHGFFLFECDHLDEAVAWAAKIPGARYGAVEIRPVVAH